MSTTIQLWIQHKTAALKKNKFEDDAYFSCLQLVLFELLVDKTYILTHPNQTLTETQIENLETNFSKLKTGIPLPYIIGEWDFFGLTFKTTHDTLIPRPETEILVEIAIEWLRQQSPLNRKIIDVGTGTGCIPIAIQKNLSDTSAIAVDHSLKALTVASINQSIHNLKQDLSFVCSDLLSSISGRYNLLTANLPYIPSEKLKKLKVLKYEPELALNGGPDGLFFIRKLLTQAPQHLAEPGLILLEIEAEQGQSVVTLAKQTFPNANIQLVTDYANRDRIVRIEI